MTRQTITEFLEARIAEDEAVARGAIANGEGAPDPARVLAECAAKRAVIDLAKDVAIIDDALMVESAGWLWETDKKILRALAAVYADHPDYQQEWSK